MECTECGTQAATQVTVEYTSGRTETLALCTDCRDEFEEGEFVQNVT